MKEEYAIASEYKVFWLWRKDNLTKRGDVKYLSGPERCIGAKGKLHKLDGWERSQALPEALAVEDPVTIEIPEVPENTPPVKRGRGRPKGSKNKPKT